MSCWFASVAQIAIAPLVQGVKYDPLRDFVPISMFSSGVIALAVNNDLNRDDEPRNSSPRPLPSRGSSPTRPPGSAHSLHLGGAMFASRAGIQMLHVPYKARFPRLQALPGRAGAVYVGNFAELHPLVEAGKIGLATATRERVAGSPDLPTVARRCGASSWPAGRGCSPGPNAEGDRRPPRAGGDRRGHRPGGCCAVENLSVNAVGSTSAEFTESIRKTSNRIKQVISAAGLEKLP